MGLLLRSRDGEPLTHRRSPGGDSEPVYCRMSLLSYQNWPAVIGIIKYAAVVDSAQSGLEGSGCDVQGIMVPALAAVTRKFSHPLGSVWPLGSVPDHFVP